MTTNELESRIEAISKKYAINFFAEIDLRIDITNLCAAVTADARGAAVGAIDRAFEQEPAAP